MPVGVIAELDRRLDLPAEGGEMATLGAWQQSLDAAAKAYASRAQTVARDVIRLAREAWELWEMCCQAVVDGHSAGTHSLRERLLRHLAAVLKLLGNAHDYTRFAS